MAEGAKRRFAIVIHRRCQLGKRNFHLSDAHPCATVVGLGLLIKKLDGATFIYVASGRKALRKTN